MITISLCMIVKNEAETIANCLESVKDVVDEIVIVDTGSTDNTKEIVSSYTSRIIDFNWIDDFAAARNFSFQHAAMDYILWLDADDVLLEDARNKLKQLKQMLDPSVDSVTMIYNYAFDENGNVTLSLRRNRLVKRVNHFRWHGAVHEYLAVGGNIINSDITVTHKRIHQHTGRNLAIFEKRMSQGESFTPRDLYYYANELRDHGLYEKASEMYHHFLEGGKGWVEDQISACDKLADIYYRLGNSEKQMEFIFKSFEYDAPRAEFCCRLGYHFLEKNELKKSIFWYQLATRLEKPKDSWGFFQDACWTWLPHLQLCICYYRLGDFVRSYEHNEMARLYRPNDEHVLSNKALLEGVLNHDIPER